MKYIIIVFGILVACQSMLQNKGQVYYINTNKGETHGTTNYSSSDSASVDAFIDYSLIDKAWRTVKSITGKNNTTKEVNKMESMLTELTTAITSAIAGVYCLVKVIINIINKFKK